MGQMHGLNPKADVRWRTVADAGVYLGIPNLPVPENPPSPLFCKAF